jgi:hypothetical protein
VLAGMIYWEFLPTFIQFEQNHFRIYKCPVNTIFSLSQGSVGTIENVFHTLKTFGSGKHRYDRRVIIIQTNLGEDWFGKGLSWAECSWLVDMIQAWLESVTQNEPDNSLDVRYPSTKR